jgi:hypothetical protein
MLGLRVPPALTLLAAATAAAGVLIAATQSPPPIEQSAEVSPSDETPEEAAREDLDMFETQTATGLATAWEAPV